MAALLAALSGCTERAPASTAPLVRDSAGIEIVENRPAGIAAAERLALATEPELRIRSDEAAGVVLFQVSAVAPLPDGRIVVGNAGAEVLIYAPDGALAVRFGREGDGPGEFRSVGDVVPMPGDSLAVWDPSWRRLSVFDGRGRLGRTVSLEERTPPTGWSRLLPLGDGELALIGFGGFPRASEGVRGVVRTEAEWHRLAPDGAVTGSFGTWPGDELFVGVGGMGWAMFSARSWAAPLEGGLIMSTAVTTELRRLDREGLLVGMVRWPDRDRTVTPERMEEVFAHMRSVTPEGQREAVERLLSDMPRAEREPPFEGLLVSDQGDIWVGDYPGAPQGRIGLPVPARTWTVFDRGGVVVAVVGSPPGLELHAIAGGRVYGVFTDDLGVESVHVHRLTPSP